MAKSNVQAGMGPFIPPSLSGGNLPGTPQAGFPQALGKTRSIQNLGNYIGQRAAGLTAAGIGNSGSHQFARAFGHYGKSGDEGLKGI